MKISERLSLEEVRKIQLDILAFVDETLKKHHIEYWLDGGTLLGCIRHKGYIPWDDDIDLIIRRSDYDRAVELLNSSSDRFKVMTMANTEGYYYLFAKVIDTTTSIKEKGTRPIEDLGIYVDLFPLDTLPDDARKRKKFFDKIFCLRAVIYNALLTEEKYQKASLTGKMKCCFGKIYGWKRAMQQIDWLCRKSSLENQKYVADIVALPHKHGEVPAEVFEKTEWREFEGRQYPIPIGYHEYLSAVYGDYMKLPPKEDRVLKHDFFAYRKKEIKEEYQES